MKYLLDSDFLVACIKEDDFSHSRAVGILDNLKDDDELYICSLVRMESVTVVSKRIGMTRARELNSWLDKLQLNAIFIDEDLMGFGWKMFLIQTKKGSSFIDSMNLVLLRKFGLDKMLSFDKFYPKELSVK